MGIVLRLTYERSIIHFLSILKGVDDPVKHLIDGGATVLLFLSAVVIFGWHTESSRLIQIHPSYVPMQFNTALGFGLIGVSLLLLNYQRQVFARGFASLLCVLGMLTLSQYIFDINLGIDELFVDHHIEVETSHPGRMAPNTALNFMLSGAAIAFINRRRLTLNSVFFASLSSALVTVFGFVALFGYLSGVETAYGWGKLTRMALHTSVGFVWAGLWLMIVTAQISLSKLKQIPLGLLPMVAGMSVQTITIALWQALVAAENLLVKQYSVDKQNTLAELILISGSFLAISLAIALYLIGKLQQQLEDLKEAQQRILQLNSQLEKLSYLDSLTGIPNRRMFDLTLEKEWGRALRNQTSLALVFIDLDCFKPYNDFYGHQQGDLALAQIAIAINRLARRTTDLAARYGGEEFVLLLPEANAIYAQAIAAELVRTIRDLALPHLKSNVLPLVTISAGVSLTVPQPSMTPKELLQAADQALYQAKAKGRNQAVFYDAKKNPVI
ncbi:diguanylate cyclase [[Limnothrix rosea] IAM M-220]|uniref:diguanylate cyclase n=1 Tax=[Limnothrix rosea] IAM M-220 TaxID=454133 RepID=UPI00095DA363|nr:diguanylate cyclase [[Limnothrix rosea] IAM M-220]OKH18606.1 hypothetical protein NIES208_05200 [[Limnothrix rosea] IAM M-220]